MKISIYVIVFAVIVAVIAIAAVSSFVFNKNFTTTKNVTLSNLTNYGQAPNIRGISAWINSPPLNITKLKGKVVVVDFWTYSCINCIRTIPFLNALQNEYGNDGLVIIGVHTPEFQFEHNLTNVQNAVKRFNITYAVALDNNYSTWDAYSNQFWPADYIIDKNGTIRYESFGESPTDFNQTQQVIRELLVQAGYTIPANGVSVKDAINFTQNISPEMYLGYEELESGRTNYIGDLQGIQPNETTNYTIRNISTQYPIYLSGEWYNAPDSMIATSNNSRIILFYRAKSVNIVASGNNGVANITILLNGTIPQTNYIGSDVKISGNSAKIQVSNSRLYNLISGPSYGVHELEINATPGFRIYTFTFG